MVYKKLIVLCLLFATVCIQSSCPPALAGENQWRMIYRLGNCIGEVGSIVEDIDSDLLSIGDVLLSAINNVDVDLLSVGDVLNSKIMDIDADLLSIGDVLLSAINNIDVDLLSVSDDILSAIDAISFSCADTSGLIISVSDVLTSLIENVDADVLSVGDVLNSKIMDIDADLLSISDSILSAIDALSISASDCGPIIESVGDVLLSAIDALSLSAIDNSGLIISVSDVLTSLIENVDADLLSIGDVLNSKIMDIDADLLSVSDDILSAIDAISCGDNSALVLSVSDVLTSLIEDIDTNLFSISDNLVSLIDGLNQTAACAPLITFNDSCDANRIDYIALEFNYGLPGDQVNVTTVGGGTTGETSGLVFLSTPNTGNSVTVTSARTVPLNPGDEAYAVFAASFVSGTTIQWIGLLDANDGIAVGYSTVGGQFSVLYRNDGVDTVIPQTSFNVDPLDGTGPSGFTLVPTNLNSFRVSFAWYGTNLIRYQVLNTDGEWITFHEIANVNTQTTAAFSNPYLPMSMTQTALGSAPTEELSTTAWRAGVIHSGDNNAGTRTFAFDNTVTTIATTETYMFTIRNKTTFGGEPNKVLVRLSRVGGGNGTNDVTPVILRYYKNAVLTGAAFTDVNTANSVVEVDTTASAFTGGHLLWMFGDADIEFEYTPDESMEFYLGPGESITVTANQLAGLASLALYATAVWEELQ